MTPERQLILLEDLQIDTVMTSALSADSAAKRDWNHTSKDVQHFVGLGKLEHVSSHPHAGAEHALERGTIVPVPLFAVQSSPHDSQSTDTCHGFDL